MARKTKVGYYGKAFTLSQQEIGMIALLSDKFRVNESAIVRMAINNFYKLYFDEENEHDDSSSR